MLRIFSNRKRVKLFSVLKNMPQFRENRIMRNGYPFDTKIFSMLKILAKAIIVKTSRGTQNTNNKQTETNGLG